MSNQTLSPTITKFRPVYLSDLGKIQSIFKEMNSPQMEEKTTMDIAPLAITDNFGLPLVIVECNKEIIGFTSVILQVTTNRSFIRQFIKKEFEKNVDELELIEYSKNVVNKTFKIDEQNISTLKFSIERFIFWLNKT